MNKDASDDTGNLNTATESVCPKGWALPTMKQIDSNRETTNFTPILGGLYSNGALGNESTYGYWWGSGASNGAVRSSLNHYDDGLYTGTYNRRNHGFYIRCVSEEKTVTDLTYLQDMTGEIADKIAIFLRNYFIYIL